MVLEVAILNLVAGEAERFEAAFREAQSILAANSGYQRHELRRCLEAEDRYLLLVWGDDLESHTEGFRGSAGYARWRALRTRRPPTGRRRMPTRSATCSRARRRSVPEA